MPVGFGFHLDRIMGFKPRESWGVGRDVWISLQLFLKVVIKQKPDMQNIVMMTVESSRETLKNVCGHLRKQTSPLISSIWLVPKVRDTGCLPLYPIILWLLVSPHILVKVTDCISEFIVPRAVFLACIQTSTTFLTALHAKNNGNRRLLKGAIFL